MHLRAQPQGHTFSLHSLCPRSIHVRTPCVHCGYCPSLPRCQPGASALPLCCFLRYSSPRATLIDSSIARPKKPIPCCRSPNGHFPSELPSPTLTATGWWSNREDGASRGASRISCGNRGSTIGGTLSCPTHHHNALAGLLRPTLTYPPSDTHSLLRPPGVCQPARLAHPPLQGRAAAVGSRAGRAAHRCPNGAAPEAGTYAADR